MEFVQPFGGGVSTAPLLVSAGVESEGCLVVWEIQTGTVQTSAAVDSPISVRPPLPPPSQFFSSLHRHRCQSLNSVWLPYQVVKALPPTEESDSRFFVSAGGSTFTVWSLTASMELAFEKLQLPVAPAAAGRPPTVAIAALGQSRWAFGSILVSHSTAGAGAAHSTTPAAHRLQCGGCSARND